MKRTRSLTVVGVAVAGVVGLLAACSGTPQGTSTDGSSGTSGTGSGSHDTLTIAIPNEPDTLDVLNSNPDTLLSWIGPNVAETLGKRSFDPDEVQPLLATEWKQTSDTVWSITLRQGVKFSNGQEMTAEDAAASITYGNTDNSSVAATYWVDIASAQATGDYTLDITTTKPDPAFPKRLPFIFVLPKSELTADALASDLIGSGPYKLVQWNRGQDLELTANDSYWGGTPKFKTVDFIVRPEASVRADTVRTGEADLALQMQADNIDGVKVLTEPGSDTAAFYLNTTGQADGSIMTDLRIREAVNYAIDRPTIIKSLFGGYAAPTNGQFNSTTMTGTDPDLKDFAYDPDKAKQLVQDAGDVGKTVTIVYPQNTWNQGDELAQAVGAYIDAIGLKSQITGVDYNSWLTQHRSHPKNGDAPDLFMAYVGNVFYDSTMKGIPDMTTGSWLINDPKLTALANAATTESDPAKRAADGKAAWDYFAQNAMGLPVAIPEWITAVGADVQFQARPDNVVYIESITLG